MSRQIDLTFSSAATTSVQYPHRPTLSRRHASECLPAISMPNSTTPHTSSSSSPTSTSSTSSSLDTNPDEETRLTKDEKEKQNQGFREAARMHEKGEGLRWRLERMLAPMAEEEDKKPDFADEFMVSMD